MDHPLCSEKNKSLRRGLYKFLSEGFSIPRQSNIIFVCGGNKPDDMRKRFQEEFDKFLPGYQFFEPEFAMRKYWSLGDDQPFDITTFEELVGELSHSIIIFPEGPGSFAETGYFSAKPNIAKKVLLAINKDHLKIDSFISIGPAKRIDDVSKFQPYIEMDYQNPDFSRISERIIGRAPLLKTMRALSIKKFNQMHDFDLFAIIQCLVSLLSIATIQDIDFFLRGLFSGNIAPSKVKQIVSILVGSRRLVDVGQFGHLKVDQGQGLVLAVKDGAKSARDALMVDISTAYVDADPDFLALLGGEDDH